MQVKSDLSFADWANQLWSSLAWVLRFNPQMGGGGGCKPLLSGPKYTGRSYLRNKFTTVENNFFQKDPL